jgi:transposase
LPKSSRQRGGQPGHPKHERTLIPSEQCDDVVSYKPTACRRCGAKLRGQDSAPLRHQVWEVPLPKPVVVEHQLHRLKCVCGQTTCGRLPEDVPAHTSGPRLVATTAILMGLFRQSKRRTALALETLFGVPCSPGLVVKQQQRATAALKSCHDELTAALPHAPAVCCDETPFRQGTAKAWLWVTVAETFSVFTIRLTRAATVPIALLGAAFAGAISSDRYAAYNTFNARRQICWAHLKRDIQSLIDAGGDGVRIGERLRASLRDMFHHWHRYRDGTIQRQTMRNNIRKHCQWSVWDTLEDGQRSPHAPTATLCGDLFQRFDQLWMFLDHPGLEPTNNRAERSLRHAVIWRKLSHGTQSASGSRFVETLLSVIETCRQQERNVIDFITAAIEAHSLAKPIPKLLAGV